MRPLRALGIYIAVVFIGGALLAPWLYWLAQSLGHSFPKLASFPFSRFVSRSLLILALAGIWPLLKSLGAKSLSDIGLVRPAGQWQKFFGGFALASVSLAIVALAAIAANARLFDNNFLHNHFGERISGAIATGLVVAVLEEILFRGAIFGAFKKVFDWRFALVLSSMIYAIVHFLEGVKTTEPVTWFSGLVVLPRMLHGFTVWHDLVPGFFTLTLVGALLALAYQRTGNLYFSIGLHAGWIFWLKSYGVFTNEIPGASTWFWGTLKMTNGWFALMVLSATLAVFSRLPMKRKNEFVR